MKSKRVGGPVIPHSPMMIRKNKKKRTHLESEVGKGFERRQMFREMQCTNTVRRGRTKTKRKERGTRGKRNVPRKKSYTEWPFPESADMTRYRAACLLVFGWFPLRCRIGRPKGDFRAAASDGGCPIALVPQWQCAGPVHTRQTRRTHRADRTRPILSRTTNDWREVRQLEFTARQHALNLCEFLEHALA